MSNYIKFRGYHHTDHTEETPNSIFGHGLTSVATATWHEFLAK